MTEIIIVLSATHAASLGSIRTYPELLAARAGELIWVRGIPLGKPDKKISQLPVLHTYFADEQERLFIAGATTPIDKLPVLNWEPLLSFIKVTLPVSALPGVLKRPQAVTLARREGNVIISENDAILTTLEAWETYVSTAPLVRLQHLYFAVSENREALIIGTPLIPVPGKVYTLRNNILLPAGFDFDPPVIASLVASALNRDNNGVLLFHQNGHWEKIKFDCFVPATRSAVRLTNSMI
jgi:hypothetical protein